MKKIKLYTEEQVMKLCYAIEEACLEVPESKITTSDDILEFIKDETITEIPLKIVMAEVKTTEEI